MDNNVRVRKTGLLVQQQSNFLTQSTNNVTKLTDNSQSSITKKNSKRRRILSEEEKGRNRFHQRSLSLPLSSLSLTGLLDKVLVRPSPQIPDIIISPPQLNLSEQNFIDDSSLLDEKDEGLMQRSGRRRDSRGRVELNVESHPVKLLSTLFSISTTSSWMNEMEGNNSKVLRWQRNSRSHSESSDIAEDDITDFASYDTLFDFQSKEEETSRLYGEINHCIRNHSCKTVRSLLKKHNQLDVNVLLPQGGSLLHEASHQGCLKCMRILLKCGSYVNLEDDQGFTPLHAAVMGTDFRSVRFLLDNDAAVDRVNVEGLSPCHLAVLVGDVRVVRELVVVGMANPLLMGAVVSPFQVAVDLERYNVLTYFLSLPSLLVTRDIT